MESGNYWVDIDFIQWQIYGFYFTAKRHEIKQSYRNKENEKVSIEGKTKRCGRKTVVIKYSKHSLI